MTVASQWRFMITIFIWVPLASSTSAALCPGGKHVLAPGVHELLGRLVATKALAPFVPAGWRFEQVTAHENEIELRLATAEGRAQTVLMRLSESAPTGDARGRFFDIRAPVGVESADARMLIQLARVIDDSFTDTYVRAPNDTALERKNLGPEPPKKSDWWTWGWVTGQISTGPRWLALSLGGLELLIAGLTLLFTFFAPVRKERNTPDGTGNAPVPVIARVVSKRF